MMPQPREVQNSKRRGVGMSPRCTRTAPKPKLRHWVRRHESQPHWGDLILEASTPASSKDCFGGCAGR